MSDLPSPKEIRESRRQALLQKHADGAKLTSEQLAEIDDLIGEPAAKIKKFGPRLNVKQLAALTGKTRDTIGKRLVGVPFIVVKGQQKSYETRTALEAIYVGNTKVHEGEFVSAAEASRQLTVARKEQIDLEMEVTRKERIPLAVLEEINDEVFSNVAGMIKAHEGKLLTSQAIADMLTELRSIGHAVREASK